MKIVEVTDEHILFNNESKITFGHEQDCCEMNYADFQQLEEAALYFEFDDQLMFEPVDSFGFRFGNPSRMFFVPCYSNQNGYYSNDVDIYYDDEKVISNLACEEFE